MSEKILKWEVKKRTFEGKEDKSKNNNPLTSEYLTNSKWILIYKVQYKHGGIADLTKIFKTKKDAIKYVKLKE